MNHQEKLLSEQKRKDQESTQKNVHQDTSTVEITLKDTEVKEDKPSIWYSCDWDHWYPDN